jgi:hypothetical protein
MVINDLSKKYLSNLSDDISFKHIININLLYTGQFLENIIEIQFQELYSHLLILFYHSGVIEKFVSSKSTVYVNYSAIIARIEKYLYVDNKDERIWRNGLYAIELRPHQQLLFKVFNQYNRQYFDDILAQNYNWIYYNTDHIFLFNNNFVLPTDAGIPYKTRNVIRAIFDKTNRYIIHFYDNNIIHKGYSTKEKDNLRKEDLINILKQQYRKDYIKTLIEK